MPRNEFEARDRDEESEDFHLEVLRDGDGNPVRVIKVYPGKGSSEDLNPEDAPDLDVPELRTATSSLADLRKSSQSVTEAHIARARAGTPSTDEIKEMWKDPDHIWEI